MNTRETKERIIQAGQKAVDELIKVAEEAIITDSIEADITADKLKNAASAKKLAIFDAFEILARIEDEEALLKQDDEESGKKKFKGFAEGRSK